MVLRHGRYGEFVSCSGYPECKYVKQNFIGVKCPQCKDGEIVEKKARRRGNLFYGCSNYPKCDFTSAHKPVAEKCPECGSPYLLEKNLKAGTFLVCPNNRKTAADEEDQPKRKKRSSKGKADATPEAAPAVKCDFSKQITKAAEAQA
jgi:DNA topoisomerase-1